MVNFKLKDSDEFYLCLSNQPKRFDVDSPATNVFFDDTNGQVIKHTFYSIPSLDVIIHTFSSLLHSFSTIYHKLTCLLKVRRNINLKQICHKIFSHIITPTGVHSQIRRRHRGCGHWYGRDEIHILPYGRQRTNNFHKIISRPKHSRYSTQSRQPECYC